MCHPLLIVCSEQRAQQGGGLVPRLEALLEQLREHGQIMGIGGAAQQPGGCGGNLLRRGPADKLSGHGAVLPEGVPEHLTGQGGGRIGHLVHCLIQHHLHPLEIPGVHRPFAGIQPDVLRVG